jgi:ribosomal protein L40E
MPELDPDLVRILTLSLLGVIILVLLFVLSSLSRIRRDVTDALERFRSAGADAGPAEAARPDTEAAQAEPARAEASPAQAGAVHAEAAAAALEAAGPGVVAAEPAEHAREPEPEPVAAEQQPVAAVESEPAVESQAAAVEEPQEQPFERDGRWWFRRGDELLVYDEATGQWIASPQEAAPAAAPQPAGAMATTISGVSGASQVAQQREPQAAAEPEAAGFWKCPSCGAVNGSTATSCRMCFAARP